mmetsp:Transcript_73309/g.159016  ORF Transcript_73309/g.159016 Transcript_73309/m.159016 type:complete len:264 (-) Transcript_73309:70-861(-)
MYGSAQQDGFVKQPLQRIDLLRMFPTIFSTCMAVLFFVPIYLTLVISLSPAVSHFSTNWSLVTMLIPLILAVVHYIHQKRKVPNKHGVIMATVVPSALLLILSNSAYLDSLDYREKLASLDCAAFPEKQSVQKSWEAAYNLYTECLQQTNTASGYSLEHLMENFRIQDCQEYGKMMKTYQRDWDYLRYLEETQSCSGWCYRGQQLWSVSPAKDSCSTVVSVTYDSFVRPHAAQVIIMSLSILLLTAIGLITFGPIMRAYGLRW